MTKIEQALWALAVICAVLLIPSWRNPKTVHVHESGSQVIQGWGWQNVASWTGCIAVATLVAARSTRPRAPFASVCAAVAAAFFAIAAAEAARTWIDLTKEAANPEVYGYGLDYTLRPATGMGSTILLAIAGAAFTLVLLGTWLRPGDSA